jgi:hypothetical protein
MTPRCCFLLPDRSPRAKVRTHKLNENSSNDFEPRTELNQPVGGFASVKRQLRIESPLVGGPRFAAGNIGGEVRKFV